MKKRTAFISVLISMVPLVNPLVIKSSIFLSTSGVLISTARKVNAESGDIYFERGIEKAR